jgi:hypothetical protein
MIYRLAGDNEKSIFHYLTNIRMSEAIGVTFNTGVMRRRIAEILASAGRLSDAALYAEQAVQELTKAGRPDQAEIARRVLEEIGRAQHAG